MNLKSDFIKYHIPVILYCTVIFVLSSFPGTSFPKIDFAFSDKIIHSVMYFGLGIAFYISLNRQSKINFLKNYALIFALIFSIFYAYSDEFHQIFVPFRYYDLYDWLFDCIGIVIGLMTFILIMKRKK